MRDITSREIIMAVKMLLAVIVIVAMIAGAIIVEVAPLLFHLIRGLF